MRLPRMRFTVRRLMTAVCCAALVLTAVVESHRRRERAHRLADLHRELANLSETASGRDYTCGTQFVADPEGYERGYEQFLKTKEGRFRQLMIYHYNMSERYGQAMQQFWPVGPEILAPPYLITRPELEQAAAERDRKMEAESAGLNFSVLAARRSGKSKPRPTVLAE